MRRNCLGLWLLLVTAFAFFAVLSVYDPIEVCGYALKSSKIVPTLTADAKTKAGKVDAALGVGASARFAHAAVGGDEQRVVAEAVVPCQPRKCHAAGALAHAGQMPAIGQDEADRRHELCAALPCRGQLDEEPGLPRPRRRHLGRDVLGQQAVLQKT